MCWWGRRGQKSPPCSASPPTAPVGKDSPIPMQTLQSLLQQVWFGKHSLALQPVRVGWCQLSSGTCVLWLLLCCRSTVLLRYASLQVVLGLKRHRSLSEIFHALPLHYFSPSLQSVGQLSGACRACMSICTLQQIFPIFSPSCDVGDLNACQRSRTRLCLGKLSSRKRTGSLKLFEVLLLPRWKSLCPCSSEVCHC